MNAYLASVYTGTIGRQRMLLSANDLHGLERKLKERGHILLHAQKLPQALTPLVTWILVPQVKCLSLVLEQLAHLMSAGLALERALEALVPALPQSMRAYALDLRAHLRHGHPFSDALTQVFANAPPIVLAIIRAAEQASNLAEGIGQAAQLMDETRQNRRSLLEVLLYPALVSLLFLGITGILMTQVVPQVVHFLSAVQQELPLSTQVLLSVAAFLEDFGHVLGLFLLASVMGAWILWQVSFLLRVQLQAFAFKIPAIGPLIYEHHWAHLLMTLSRLLNAGIPLIDAMAHGARALPNLYLRQRLDEARQKVACGQGLAQSLEGFAPPFMLIVLAVGEQSAHVATMAEKASRMIRQRVDQRRKRLLALLHPMALLVLALILFWLASATLLPIYDSLQRLDL